MTTAKPSAASESVYEAFARVLTSKLITRVTHDGRHFAITYDIDSQTSDVAVGYTLAEAVANMKGGT